MTQEEKDLILIDLCGRLPYDIKIKDEYGDYINVNIYNANIEHLIDRITSGLDKIVLRPLSSITEEENLSLAEFVGVHVSSRHGEIYFPNLNDNTACNWYKVFDWLNRNMFDYHGLIPAGLANAAPEEIYIN